MEASGELHASVASPSVKGAPASRWIRKYEGSTARLEDFGKYNNALTLS
jgi:hypothetical protein